jgi:outer membrane lipoprotein-sorting protein
MWVIYPRLKRAEKYPLAGTGGGEWRDTLALLEAGFPRDQADFNARFRLLSLTQFESSWLLTLQPRRESARKMLHQIQVGFSTNDFSLTLNALEFADGSSMKNVFTNAVLNPAIDKTVFDWKPPPDFKITEPLAR